MATNRTAELNAKGLAAARRQATPQLVDAYKLTDKLMDDVEAGSDDYYALVTSRGWIMDVLAERGEEGDAALLDICGLEEW